MSCAPIGMPAGPLNTGIETAGTCSVVQIWNSGTPAKAGDADRRLAEGRGRQQHVDAAHQRVEPPAAFVGELLGLDVALEAAVDAVVQPAAAQACR